MFLLTLLVCCGQNDSNSTCGPSSALVSRVVDGDTIVISTGDKVRYLLVDAPEIAEGACFAEEAKNFNESLVGGRTVSLEYSASQCRDNFGRLLAYVYVGGLDVNLTLVKEGYACVYIYEPGVEKREEEFRLGEAQAIAHRKGLWGICEEVPCGR